MASKHVGGTVKAWDCAMKEVRLLLQQSGEVVKEGSAWRWYQNQDPKRKKELQMQKSRRGNGTKRGYSLGESRGPCADGGAGAYVRSELCRLQLRFPGGPLGRELACRAGDAGNTGSVPGSGRSTLVAAHPSVPAWGAPQTEEPGSYSPRGRTESDTAEATQHAHTHKFWTC